MTVLASPSTAVAPLLRLEDSVRKVAGVTAARAKAYLRLDVATVGDLLRLAPRRYEDRRTLATIAALKQRQQEKEREPKEKEAKDEEEPEEHWTLLVRVVSARPFRFGWRKPVLDAVVADESDRIAVRWFGQPWLTKTVVPGARLLLHGALRRGKDGVLRFSCSEQERLGEDDDGPHPAYGRIVPVHPLTRGVVATGLRHAVWDALGRLGPLDDPMPPECLGSPPLPGLADAIRAIHFPADERSAEEGRRRLAYDELFLHEMLLARRKRERQAQPGIPFRWTPTLDRRIRARLPFSPTPGQEGAIRDIVADLRRPAPMNRLLQGDVGSGKTAVAAYACLACVANGAQAAFMAPTDVLARQHEATLGALLRGSRVRVVALRGGMGARERREALARIASGEADLVVGTHAVISRGVEFARLGLAVVDEQHKFGVRQRRDLATKGAAPHVLVMTATPIPRTLAMVVYGDLDVSIVPDRPPGRSATETWVAKKADERRVVARVREELARGRQAFVVYPLVEESDRVGLAAATEGREAWERDLPGRRVGLVHGRLDARERDRAMEDFRRRRTDVLVATVVIEVGIDVPNATMLVVEHAERFGLSQLHQLRGRVGRGTAGGLCVLFDRSGAGTPDRLRVLASTDDGFRIAEEDLRLRGSGDLFGTRQHGAPAFAAARFPDDLHLLVRAREEVGGLLRRDPELASAGVAAIRARVAERERRLGDPTKGG